METTAYKNKHTYVTRLTRDYKRRVARMKRARGALAHHGTRLTRALTDLSKERERAVLRAR